MDVDVLSAAGALKPDVRTKKTIANVVKHVDSTPINRVVNHEQQKPANWVDIRDEFLAKPHRRLKVITIGAGFSGRRENLDSQML